jgi:hypothetical protein
MVIVDDLQIDRAVMLPRDFTEEEEEAFEDTRSRRLSRRESSIIPDDMPMNFRRGSTSGASVFLRDPSPGATPVTGISNPAFRRDSSPGTTHYRSGSNNSGGGGGQAQTPNSPGGLQFSLPRGSLERERDREKKNDSQRSPVALKGVGSGALSPVKESSMSRANTRG